VRLDQVVQLSHLIDIDGTLKINDEVVLAVWVSLCVNVYHVPTLDPSFRHAFGENRPKFASGATDNNGSLSEHHLEKVIINLI
jgi:hypothetical protein